MGKNKRMVDKYSLTHFIERAKERYNIDFTEKDYIAMNSIISKMKAENQPPLVNERDTEIYKVLYLKGIYICVWHKIDNHITTLLPKDPFLN